MTAVNDLPLSVLDVLRDADHAILALRGGSHYPLYHLLRVACQRLARVDSFYIGFFCVGEAAMVFPYSYDGAEYDDPEKASYSPDGITAWILAHQEAYWSPQDGGLLLRRGRRFGNEAQRSAETIVVPLLRPAGPRAARVMGLLGVLSYEEGSYSDSVVTAVQWLAASAATALHREHEDEARRRELGSSRHPCARPAPVESVVEEISTLLRGLRRQAEALQQHLPLSDCTGEETVHATNRPALRADLAALCRACEQGQTDMTERLMQTLLTHHNPLTSLTEAEQRVLPLLVGGCTDREIAETLCLSPHTVKTHCRSILQKFGVKGRAGVIEIARPFLTSSSCSAR